MSAADPTPTSRQAIPVTGTRRHWITLLFCVAPLVALAAIFLLGIPASRVLLWAFVLLCPLSHLLLGRGGHGHAHGSDSRAIPIERSGATESSRRGGSYH